VVRQAFLTSFPDDRLWWFHKPIGPPVAALSTKFAGEIDWTEAAEWYWKVMRHAFPKAKFLTILRHPCDIVLSSKARWGYDETALWQAVGLMAHILTHRASPVEYALSFDELINQGETVARQLFSFVDLPFAPEVMQAFARIHAPARGREILTPQETSRHEQWGQLDPTCIKPAYREAIAALFKKFGQDFEWPVHFDRGDRSSAIQVALSEPPTPEGVHQSANELRLRADCANKLLEQAQSFRATWQKQSNWIAQLEQARAWLDEQRRRWHKLARRHETYLQCLYARRLFRLLVHLRLFPDWKTHTAHTAANEEI
jgi:hypothetical protein